MTNDIIVPVLKLPALKQVAKHIKAFKQFEADAEEVAAYHEELTAALHDIASGREIPDDVEPQHRSHARLIRDAKAGLRRFDRDGDNDPRYDHEDDLTVEYVVAQLRLLFRGWLNKRGLPDAEAIANAMHMMIEWILAYDTSAAELQSTCFKLVEEGGKAFVPQTPGLLEVLRVEQKSWKRRRDAIRCVEFVYEDVVAAIANAKAAAEAAEAEAARRRAEAIAAQERRRADAELDAQCRKIDAEEQAARQVEEWIETACGNGQFFGRLDLPIEQAIEAGRSTYRNAPADCLVAFALGCFAARRELRFWENSEPQRSTARRKRRGGATRKRPRKIAARNVQLVPA